MNRWLTDIIAPDPLHSTMDSIIIIKINSFSLISQIGSLRQGMEINTITEANIQHHFNIKSSIKIN